jgi:hypothetical protein
MEDATTKGAVKSPLAVRMMYNQIEDESPSSKLSRPVRKPAFFARRK